MPHPEFLDQVHVSSFVLLHAALRNAGHVRRQRAVDQHAQHVQYGGEELTTTNRKSSTSLLLLLLLESCDLLLSAL